MIYFVVFVISYVIFRRASVLDDQKSNSYKVSLCASAIPILLLAILRGNSVGVDNMGYQYPLYLQALRYSDAFSFIASDSTKESLYLLFTYVGTKLGGMMWIHLLNSSIVILFLYLTIWELRDEVDATLAFLSFLFLFYGELFNTVRQYMAVSVGMYALVKYAKKQYKIAALLTIVAIGFHASAISLIAVYIIYTISQISNQKPFIIGSVIGVVLLAFAYQTLIPFVTNIISPILLSKYTGLSSRYYGNGNFRTSEIVLLAVGILLTIYFIRTDKNRKGVLLNNFFYLYCFIISIPFVFIGVRSDALYRIIEYFDRYLIFIIPRALELVKNNSGNRLIARFFFWVFLIAYFYLIYAIRGKAGIFPYVPFWA